MFHSNAHQLTISLLTALCLTSMASAQRATVSVAGQVRDSSSAGVPGAKVLVRNQSTAVERQNSLRRDVRIQMLFETSPHHVISPVS